MHVRMRVCVCVWLFVYVFVWLTVYACALCVLPNHSWKMCSIATYIQYFQAYLEWPPMWAQMVFWRFCILAVSYQDTAKIQTSWISVLPQSRWWERLSCMHGQAWWLSMFSTCKDAPYQCKEIMTLYGRYVCDPRMLLWFKWYEKRIVLQPFRFFNLFFSMSVKCPKCAI